MKCHHSPWNPTLTHKKIWWSINPDSKVHGANMGPIWGRQDPDGPHVGPMNFAIWELIEAEKMAAISKTTVSNAFSWMKMHAFRLKFHCLFPINNIPALVQIMAWRRPGDKPLSEPMMVSLLTHIGVSRSQWVDHTHCFVWDAFTYPYPNFNVGITERFQLRTWMSKKTVKHGHGWVRKLFCVDAITSPCPNPGAGWTYFWS